MDIDYDTSEWLGCPTPEEMYKHQCALLEDEFAEVQAQLTKARKNIAGLIKMNDAMVAAKTYAEKALSVALADVCRLNRENSEMGARIVGLISVVDQRDHLFRENQRLLGELRDLKEASAAAPTRQAL